MQKLQLFRPQVGTLIWDMRDTSDWLNKSFYISFLLGLCRCVMLVQFLTNSVLYLSLHYAYGMLSDEDSVIELSDEDGILPRNEWCTSRTTEKWNDKERYSQKI